MYTQSQELAEPLNGILDICWSESSPCSHWLAAICRLCYKGEVMAKQWLVWSVNIGT